MQNGNKPTPPANPLFEVRDTGGVFLTEEGRRVVERGGADGVSWDTMLILEVLKRAPNMDPDGLQRACMALMEQYGPDALDAIRTGHVQFEKATGPAKGETVQ